VDNIGKHSPDEEIIFFGDPDRLEFGIGRHEVDAVFLQGKAKRAGKAGGREGQSAVWGQVLVI